MQETPKERLEGLWGQPYFDAWKEVWGEVGPAVLLSYREIKDRTGKITAADLVDLADKHALPFKTTVEQLEKERLLPFGTYDRLPPLGTMRKKIEKAKADYSCANRRLCGKKLTATELDKLAPGITCGETCCPECAPFMYQKGQQQ